MILWWTLSRQLSNNDRELQTKFTPSLLRQTKNDTMFIYPLDSEQSKKISNNIDSDKINKKFDSDY